MIFYAVEAGPRAVRFLREAYFKWTTTGGCPYGVDAVEGQAQGPAPTFLQFFVLTLTMPS